MLTLKVLSPGKFTIPGWYPALNPAGHPARPLLRAAAPRALQRLRQEGRTRHEALHALGAVLARHIGHVLPPGGGAGDARGRYVADLEGLSADSWGLRRSGTVMERVP